MQINAFIDRLTEPTSAALAAALGPAQKWWDQLLSELSHQPGATLPEWKCRSPTAGWALRTKRNKHTILWLSPSYGSFTALFVADEKALQRALKSDLPTRVLRAMKRAHRYPEGTVIRFGVKSSKDLATLKKLATLHFSNQNSGERHT